MKSCFLFGHRDAPLSIQYEIEQHVQHLFWEHGITIFYIGGYGSFDHMAGGAVKAVRKRFPEITLCLVSPYHPGEKPMNLPEGYDSLFYPPLENVPKRYAILKANQYMVRSSDAIICYAKYHGNSYSLLEYAESQAKKRNMIIKNLAEQDLCGWSRHSYKV